MVYHFNAQSFACSQVPLTFKSQGQNFQLHFATLIYFLYENLTSIWPQKEAAYISHNNNPTLCQKIALKSESVC